MIRPIKIIADWPTPSYFSDIHSGEWFSLGDLGKKLVGESEMVYVYIRKKDFVDF